MIEFAVKDGPTRRILCRNAETYTLFWPYLFSRAVPGARPLCRWAARRGAAVNGGIRLHLNKEKGCCLVATRPIEAGRALLSVPLTLSLGVSCEPGMKSTYAGRWDTLERLTGQLVRHLHDPFSERRPYLEFLHDLYNSEEGDGDGTPGRVKLMEQLEQLYAGNALGSKGVENAPFLDKRSLRTPEQRTEWVRVHNLVRRVEQNVPHFAANSAAWGVSMALSRAIQDDDEGLTLYPLIDFCSHSFEPNATLVVKMLPEENEALGVQWHEARVPCAHLVSHRRIGEGEEVTIVYSTRRVESLADEEYWRMHWGFVPVAGGQTDGSV